MARKKIVFVIVEGPSDETALGVLLSKIYDKDKVYVHIWHGDITSDRRVCPANIVSKLGSAIKGFAKLNSTDDEKENDAFQFAKMYREDVEGFLKYINESDFSVTTDYKKSWEFIRQGLHSLERHTNLGLGLKMNTESGDSI